MHLHCWFYLETGSDSHLHYRFYLETGSDYHLHCRFYLKTSSDVHAPLYKTNCQPHTSIPPAHELSQSHFYRFTLTSQNIHSLSTWFGYGSCIFQWYWYIIFFNILSIFIWSIFIFMFLCILYLYIFLFLAFDLYLIMLPHFTWKNFFCIYFMFIFFWHFIDQVVWTTDLPHHKNQVSTLAMSHSLLMWPFHGSLFQLLYEIFSNIFYFFMQTNKCN